MSAVRSAVELPPSSVTGPPHPLSMAAPAPPSGGAAPARLAPFSTHARGVPLFEWGRFLDLPRHLARILLDLRDLSSSLFWFLSCQTWLTMWGCLVTVVSGARSAAITPLLPLPRPQHRHRRPGHLIQCASPMRSHLLHLLYKRQQH